MSLDEAIEHCLEVSNKCSDKCSEDHKQLSEWLIELKNYKLREDL